MKGVLFLCQANACRSQMAEGLARSLLPISVDVFSAGSRPGAVDPRAIEALAEIGIDISHQRSKSTDETPADRVDLVITLCSEAEEDCPVFPGAGAAERLYWPLEDPAAGCGAHEEVMGVFREVRDELARRIESLTAGLAR